MALVAYTSTASQRSRRYNDTLQLFAIGRVNSVGADYISDKQDGASFKIDMVVTDARAVRRFGALHLLARRRSSRRGQERERIWHGYRYRFGNYLLLCRVSTYEAYRTCLLTYSAVFSEVAKLR